MQCPICYSVDTKVIDSRSAEGGVAIRRRRECVVCGRRFSTFERYEEVQLVVIKRSDGREPFDGAKIIAGLTAAAKGRPVSAGDLAQVAVGVEEAARLQGGEVSSEWVGLAVLDRLRLLDHVTYLRFASVYKGFDDAEDFAREARLIKLDSADQTTA